VVGVAKPCATQKGPLRSTTQEERNGPPSSIDRCAGQASLSLYWRDEHRQEWTCRPISAPYFWALRPTSTTARGRRRDVPLRSSRVNAGASSTKHRVQSVELELAGPRGGIQFERAVETRVRNLANASCNRWREYLLTGHLVCGKCLHRYYTTTIREKGWYYRGRRTRRADRSNRAYRAVGRIERTERSVPQLDSLAECCARVRRQLRSFDFAGKRFALAALGIQVVVGADGDLPLRVYSDFDPAAEFNPRVRLRSPAARPPPAVSRRAKGRNQPGRDSGTRMTSSPPASAATPRSSVASLAPWRRATASRCAWATCRWLVTLSAPTFSPTTSGTSSEKKPALEDFSHPLEQGYGFTGRHRGRDRRHVGRRADESCFCKRCGSPRLDTPASEPCHRRLVVHMVGPRQAHHEVDVKQIGQPSSRAVRTTSSVIGWADLGTRNIGKPSSSSMRGCGGTSPRRTRSVPPLPTPAVRRVRSRGSYPARRRQD
jgi:hypothetical protein